MTQHWAPAKIDSIMMFEHYDAEGNLLNVSSTKPANEDIECTDIIVRRKWITSDTVR